MKPSRQSRLGLHAITFTVVVLALAAGCGNYSNEDLEFMNALPAQEDLFANIPARSALTQGTEAELAKQTHEVARVFNRMLFDILGGVDFIRTFPPSERGHNTRTWGPWPHEKHPDWQYRFVMTRNDADHSMFTYELQLQDTTNPANVWVDFLGGSFTSTRGARRGVGTFTLQSDMVRAAGFPVEIGEGARLRSIRFDYDTRDFPINVQVTMETYPDLLDLGMWVTTTYEYGVDARGQGAMAFTVTGNLDLTSAALETLTVTSRWLPTGEGRAEATITLGDGVGLTETQCWNRDFNPTFTNKPWPVSPDSPDPSPFGAESDCPEFPTL
jgi:hypothetical protein